jgi:hypothetical protein
VIGGIAAVHFDSKPQLAIGFIAGAAISFLIVVPERKMGGRAMIVQGRWTALLVLVVLAVVGIALGLVASHPNGVDAVDDIGDGPGVLFYVAIGLVVATVVARLVAYSTSWVRAIAAVLLFAAAVRGLMAAGVIPGDHLLGKAGSWLHADRVLLYALGILAIQSLFDLAAWPIRKKLGVPEDIANGFAGVGLDAAALAALFLIAASVWGYIATSDLGSDRLPPGGHVLFAGQPTATTVPADEAGDRKLAETYAPVLTFTRDERWMPTSVDRYLAATKPGKGSGRLSVIQAKTLGALPNSCNGAPKPCWQLTIGCADGKSSCSLAERDTSDFVHNGAAYVRVVRRPDERDPTANNALGYVPQLNAKVTTLIQYWFFYAYDEWATSTLIGKVIQRHESDWEAVTVGLGDEGPLFVGYSEHCGGIWVPWKRVRVSEYADPSTGKRAAGSPLLHPLVAVAEGSHANYPRADQHFAPNWKSCTGLPDGMLTSLSYATHIRERTDYARQWYPKDPSTDLVLVHSYEAPMSFPGTWGDHDVSVIQNFVKHKVPNSGNGPQSPPRQVLWFDTLDTVFCNRYWHPWRPKGCPVHPKKVGAGA